MTLDMWVPSPTNVFSDSIFKQPLHLRHLRTRIRSRASRKLIPQFHPSSHEGHGAPRGAPCIVSLPAPLARRWSSGSASPCGAPLRRFWARGPYFRVGTGAFTPSSGRLSPPSSRTSSSRERQSHVVGPDGDPSLPDDMVANHARRRRILLRFKSALESAPHEQDVSNLRALRSAGIRIPITKCCRLCALDTIAVFPGRAFARTRNLYRDCKPVMDSGSAPSAHPGMTGWEVAASGV